ncbi:MAG: hypothetical protein IPM56_10770 [Ignavibacteriales bacterium]|nr:MAG: hypothetical protein IPM56_10770 [Ignavibacteriales bacterium]
MGYEEIRTLLSIYLNPEFDTDEEISENLKDAGIDAESFTKEVLGKIERMREDVRRMMEDV